MKSRLLLAAALAIVAAPPVEAQSRRDAALHAFLRERFSEDRGSYPDTRYVAGWADLNGDARPEALVYMMSGNYCGSGGCTLYIYTPEQGSFSQHGSMSVTNLPIRALNSRTRGWRDLSVAVGGGGTRARIVLVPHGAITYAKNPTVPPARTLPRDPAGTVVIGVDARPRPLF
jgi:putative lipoprotein